MSTHNLLEPVNCLVHAERSYCDATVGLIKSECVRAGFAALPNRINPVGFSPAGKKPKKSSAGQKTENQYSKLFSQDFP